MSKQHEKGVKVADICRDQGISQGTFYTWKVKYSGMGVPPGRCPAHSEGDGIVL